MSFNLFETAKKNIIVVAHRGTCGGNIPCNTLASYGKLVWVNSIIYDYRDQLSAGHSDDTALTESEEIGWGWLADRGFDFIQTDWPIMLINFLKSTGRYYR